MKPAITSKLTTKCQATIPEKIRGILNLQAGDSVVFDITQELPFGFAIFNNAAIAHAIKAGLLMKFEQ